MSITLVPKLKKIPVELNKCKYCGSYVITIDNYGECPKGCPGNMVEIQSFKCDIPERLTEASKVEIGLSREKLLETLHNAGFYKIIVEDRIIDALLAAESELIIKKINHPPQGRKEVNE